MMLHTVSVVSSVCVWGSGEEGAEHGAGNKKYSDKFGFGRL